MGHKTLGQLYPYRCYGRLSLALNADGGFGLEHLILLCSGSMEAWLLVINSLRLLPLLGSWS
jgi:hypothetical protein